VISISFVLSFFAPLLAQQDQGPPARPQDQRLFAPSSDRPALYGGRANPRRPGRKNVLVWADVRNGFQHDSISHAVATIERLGYESGLYDTYIRTDSQLITKHGVYGSDGQKVYGHDLNDFDAIFFFGVREIDLTAQQRLDLLSFVRDDGKGFVAAHSADTSFMSWPEFGDMLGGRFDQHPWNVVEAPVVVEDPSFPATKHFPSTFNWRDEMYQTKDLSRDKVRVLLRLDASKLDMTKAGVNRADGDFPLAWAKTYGKGRVFYSALGHDITSWDDPGIQKMYFEAIKWALGLSEGDVTPRPRRP
jgi:type 1 glutamine amidotransferase